MDPLEPIEEYRKAEWLSFEQSPYFDERRMAILEAKPLKLIFEGKEPWLCAICGVLWSVGHGGSVLQIGCGLGQQVEAIERWAPGIPYTGADVSDRCLAVCRRRRPDVAWLKASYPDLPEIVDDSFDIALLGSILRYYFPENGMRLIRAAQRIARKAVVLGLWDPMVERDEPVATSDGRGGYFVRWPAAMQAEIEALGHLATIQVPHSLWPTRRLLVVTR